MTFQYSIAAPGNVSIGIFDAAGRQVRPLQYGMSQQPGTYTVAWDGLDRYGAPVPNPERCEWRMLRTPGFSREFLVNVGINTPWAPFDVWPGNHFGPNVLHVDDDGSLYVGSVSSEGPPRLVRISIDGQVKYYDDGVWGDIDGLRGIARLGDALYLLLGSVLSVHPASNPDQMWIYGGPGGDKPNYINFTHAGDSASAPSTMHFAGGNGMLVTSYQAYNEIHLDWPAGASLAKSLVVSVPAPGDVALAPDGRVFAVSGTSLVQIDPATGNMTTVIASITAPGSIAYDPFFDDILVVNNGSNVNRYHSDGTLKTTYGRAGGREYGTFVPTDFDRILDIACNDQGDFWVVEKYPRRVVRFTARPQISPKFLETHEQYFGGLQWGSMACLDPADVTICYLCPDGKHIAKGKIDYSAQTWTLTDLYPEIPGGTWSLNTNWGGDAVFLTAGERIFWEVRHVGGETFLLQRGAGNGQGQITLLRVDHANHQLWPVACLGTWHPGVAFPSWLTAGRGLYSWSDTNGNGLVDDAEMITSPAQNQYNACSCAVDAS